MKFISKIISYFLHPVFIPLIITGCYFLSTFQFHELIVIKYSLLQVGMITFVLPILLYFILSSFKIISSSVMINNLNERKVPLFFNIVLLSILIFRIWDYDRILDLKLLFKGYLLTNIILFIGVFFNLKISIHTAIFSASLPFIILTATNFHLNFTWQFCAAIFALGSLMTARLYLKKHTNTEIILGLLTGILPQILIYKI